MDMTKFFIIYAAGLIGAAIGMLIAKHNSIDFERIVPSALKTPQAERVLVVFLAMLAVPTLAQDLNTVLGTNWELSLFGSLESKYAFILAVVTAMMANNWFRSRNDTNARMTSSEHDAA